MKKSIVLIMVITFMACAEKLMEQPENLIPKDVMINILRDMTILNAAKTTNSSVLQKNDIEPMAYLYAKYGVDSLQLAASDLYYASLPEEYQEIFTEVAAKLGQEKEQLEEAKKVNDSIKNMDRDRARIEKSTNDSLR